MLIRRSSILPWRPVGFLVSCCIVALSAACGTSGGGAAVSAGGTGSVQTGGALTGVGAAGQGAGGDARGGGETPSGGASTGTGAMVSAAGGQVSSGGTPGGGSGGGGGGSGVGGVLASGGSAGAEMLPPAAATKLGESMITSQGLRIISYGGYLNGESFQEDAIVTHGQVEYAAFWNQARHVVLAGRQLPDGSWLQLELGDYTNNEDDAHNTISIGLSPADGTLHLAFDHHDSPLHYRRSLIGFLDKAPSEWTSGDFGPVTGALGDSGQVTQVTYPRFITAPDGQSLLLNLRIGASGSGNARLWEYQGGSGSWSLLGTYVDGTSVDENPYFHGIAFTPGGTRLHLAWCDRATPDATTNHDLFYMYSDNGGRDFFSGASEAVGKAGTAPILATSDSVRVWQIAQNRGLINQEHMIVDQEGGVHVLLSHMPDASPADTDFTRARTKSQFFHYYRPPEGTWVRHPLGAAVIENFRGSLAVASSGNLYAVLPDLRLYGASRHAAFGDWSLLDDEPGRFFSDPLVDRSRLLQEDVLTIVYPEKASGTIVALDFAVE